MNKIIIGLGIGLAIAPFSMALSNHLIWEPMHTKSCIKQNAEVELVPGGKVQWRSGTGCIISIEGLPPLGSIKGIIFVEPGTHLE